MKAAALVVVATSISAIVVSMSACIDETPPSGLILCVDDSDCPEGLTCLAARHTCAEKGTAATPPSILEVRFAPPVSSGGVVELVIVADAPLSTTIPAVVKFSPGLPAPTLAFSGTDTTEQRFLIDADAVAEGGYVIDTITITDEDGDEATATALNVGLVVDRTAPDVFNAVVDGPENGVFSDVDGSNSLRLTALANEPLRSAFVEVAGVLTPCSLAVTSLSCTAFITAATPTSTTTPVFAIARDAADNERRVQLANINVDTTAPDVANVSVDVAGADVPGPGTIVTLVVVADEALSGVVVASAALDNGDVHVDLTPAGLVGSRATFVVDGDDVPVGVYVATVTFADVVGHVVSRVLTLPAPFEVGLTFAVSGPCPPTPGTSVCVDVDGDGHAGRAGCVEGDDDDDASIVVFAGAR